MWKQMGERGLDGRCSGVWGVITVRWLGQSPYGLALGDWSLLVDQCMVCIPPSKRIPKSSHCRLPSFHISCQPSQSYLAISSWCLVDI